MHPEAPLLLQFFHRQSGFAAVCAHLVARAGFHVAEADQIRQRVLDGIHEPRHKLGACAVAQDQPAVRPQHPGDFVEKGLRIGVVMEALGVDDKVKTLMGIYSAGLLCLPLFIFTRHRKSAVLARRQF